MIRIDPAPHLEVVGERELDVPVREVTLHLAGVRYRSESVDDVEDADQDHHDPGEHLPAVPFIVHSVASPLLAYMSNRTVRALGTDCGSDNTCNECVTQPFRSQIT